MTTTHLTRAELRTLTGTPIVARQVDWLRAQRWVFVLDTHQRPTIARAYHDKRMGIVDASAPPVPSVPDWSLDVCRAA